MNQIACTSPLLKPFIEVCFYDLREKGIKVLCAIEMTIRKRIKCENDYCSIVNTFGTSALEYLFKKFVLCCSKL